MFVDAFVRQLIGVALKSNNPKHLLRQSYQKLILVGMLAILVTVGMLVMLTNRIDERSVNDTRERFSLVMSEWENALQLAVEDHAYWTLAYESIMNGDGASIYDNIGSGATESELFDWIVIMDANGAVQFAFDFPEDAEIDSVFDSERRARLLSLLGEHDPAEYIAVSGAVSLGQEASLLSAAWVTPDNLTGLGSDQLPILVGGIVLGQERLASLQQSTNADAIEVSARDNTPNEMSYELDGPFGVIGHLSFKARTPGSDFRAEVLPWLVVFCAAVVIVTLSIARHFRHLASQLDKAIMLASTDPLTGLSNRAALQSFIESPLIDQALHKGEIAIVNLDLNRFKQLNDSHGHAIGDVALQITAKRLQDAVRNTDRVVRLGGDEFICLIVDEDPNEAAENISDRIVAMFKEPVDFGSFQSKLQASIGVAVSSAGDHWEDLMKRADLAMYQAKKDGVAQAMFH